MRLAIATLIAALVAGPAAAEFKRVTDRDNFVSLVKDRNLTRLGVLIGLLIGVYALQQLIHVGDNFVRHALGERFILDLRVRLYGYLHSRAQPHRCAH